MRITLFLLLFFCSIAIYSQDKKMPIFEVNLGIDPGFLTSGMQKQFFADVLLPSPQYYSSFGGYMTAQYFPFQNWGLFLGKTSYILNVEGDNTNAIDVLQSDSMNVGLSYRINTSYLPLQFGDKTIDTGYRFYVNIGTSFSSLQYLDEFKILIPAEYTLQELKSDFGAYFDCGFSLFLNRLRFSISLEDTYIKGKSSTNEIFDGNYITIPISIGYGIL